MKRNNTKKNKSRIEKAIDWYANLLSGKPLLVLVMGIILIFTAIYYSGMIKNESVDYSNMLPDDEEVIQANNIFQDAFGSTDSVKIVIETNPDAAKSNEPRDVKDPRVLEYVDALTQLLIKSSEDIESISSPTTMLRELNGGTLPKKINDVIKYEEEFYQLDSLISPDGEMLLININLVEGASNQKAVNDLESAIDSLEKMLGVTVQIAGRAVEDVYIDSQMGDDMSKTSMFSMIAIILILIIVFGSIKYGLLPLTTIIIGVIWTFGYVGFIGLPMTSMTSGVMSMIMGIGIDFGIQVINRFRQDLRELDGDIQRAMRHTMNNVLTPLFTTTLAAVIGFQSMSLGDLGFLQDMGTMMMYGVIFCFLASVTVVPSLTVFIEQFSKRIKLSKSVKTKQ